MKRIFILIPAFLLIVQVMANSGTKSFNSQKGDCPGDSTSKGKSQKLRVEKTSAVEAKKEKKVYKKSDTNYKHQFPSH
ncbi:MAG: hypothetical protein ACJ75J_09395 [Cytophagaceae bacterium]|jgi:hypothetical protein